MQSQKINHVAVWVAGVVVQFLPPLWYDTMFFGIRWMELNEVSEKDFADFSPLNFIWAILSAVALAYTLAWLFKSLNVTTALKGLQLAFLFWFSFLFLELATQNAFTLRPFELTLIDQIVVLIKYEIITLLLIFWKKKDKVPSVAQ